MGNFRSRKLLANIRSQESNHFAKHIDIPNLSKRCDVLHDDGIHHPIQIFIHNVCIGRQVQKTWQASSSHILIQGFHRIGHAIGIHELLEGKRHHLYFNISTRQPCSKLPRQQLRIGSGYIYIIAAFQPQRVHCIFPLFNHLDFIEQYVCLPSFGNPLGYPCMQSSCSSD
ncbi:hypothetical protein SDC9_95936 [bioreactor metagenome]|uniref:Uncharacterized protein n=1 Tax=bioreactor metagenome TaxID=1076179 RepID=A0A645A926_9ZZZZ